MDTALDSDLLDSSSRLYAVLKSLHDFDLQEIQGVVSSLIATSPREDCLWTTYLRTSANVESLLRLDRVCDTQGVLMLSRSIFELTIDFILLRQTPDGALKALTFRELELVKNAEDTVELAERMAQRDIDINPHKNLLARDRERVRDTAKRLWPNGNPTHWSGLKLKARAKAVGEFYEAMYVLEYRHMSWHTHAGLAGLLCMSPDALLATAGNGFSCAFDIYERLLEQAIEELGLERVDPLLKKS